MRLRDKRTQHILLIFILGYLFLFHAIGTYSLKEPDEGRYAEIPREMVVLNDYVVPHFNYVRYFEKPVLFYWAVAASYKIFGVGEWSFRFPNALAAFFCVLGLYFLGRRWYDEEAAFLSALILTTSFGFFAMARVVTLDMFFTLWLFLSLLFFYGYYKERRPFLVYLFYASLAFATLTKGLVAPILLGTTILIYLLWEKNLRFLRELKWGRGILLYGIITLPWFVAISLKEPEFFSFFVIDQQFLRFFTSKHKRTGPIYYFLPVLFGGMFPWSLLIPRAFVVLWKRTELRLFFVWTSVVFLFFSFSSSKLTPYILPIFPSCALILGSLFHYKTSRYLNKYHEICAYMIIFGLFSLAAIGPFTGWLDPILAQVDPSAGKIMMDLKYFLAGISATSFLLLILLFFRSFNTYTRLSGLFSFFSLVTITLLILHLPVIDGINTSKGLARIINAQSPGIDTLVNYGTFNESLPFYTERRVVLVLYTGELAMGAKYEDAKDSFLNHEQFVTLFNSSKSVCAVLKEKRLPYLRQTVPLNYTVKGRENEKYLICNSSYVNNFTR